MIRIICRMNGKGPGGHYEYTYKTFHAELPELERFLSHNTSEVAVDVMEVKIVAGAANAAEKGASG